MDELIKQIGNRLIAFGQSQIGFWFINGAALVLLTSGMAQWTWALVQPPQAIVQIESMTPVKSQSNALNLDQLLLAELFGRAPVPDHDEKDVPISSLNLLLTGVIAAEGESLALISVDGQEQLPFAIGQEIAHGAVLDAVYADRAIIVRQGIRESLVLKDSAAGLSLATFSHSTRSNTASRGNITPLGSNQYRLSRDLLKSQLRSPSLLSQALIVPHAGGGFQVRNVAKDSLFTKAGIQRGDIIHKINGEKINSPQDVMRIYQSLSNLDQLAEINIEIQRHGQKQSLNFRLD